jgi:molybdenum cofactor biosynthesis enzyme MoaA
MSPRPAICAAKAVTRGRNHPEQPAEESYLGALEWERIFQEAGELGVSFILLAGGEPL